MTADLLLTHFNQVFCPKDLGHPLLEQSEGSSSVRRQYIAVKDGKILDLETDAVLLDQIHKIPVL